MVNELSTWPIRALPCYSASRDRGREPPVARAWRMGLAFISKTGRVKARRYIGYRRPTSPHPTPTPGLGASDDGRARLVGTGNATVARIAAEMRVG
jgi:hypothetical protein